METVFLGDGQLLVSRIGFGGCPLGGHGWGANVDQSEAIQAVRRAFELGINFFDTADVYGLGRSEELLADSLGHDRSRVVIATKFGVCWDEKGRTWKDISPRHLREALESSLKRLRLECIPLYYVHWPDGKTPIEEVVAELDSCRRQGKIQAIGLSNFTADQLQKACQVAKIAALQLQYSLVDRYLAADALGEAERQGVPFVTWGSLAQGLLSGKYKADARFGHNDRRHRYENFSGVKFDQNLRVVEELQTIAQRIGATPAQVAIRWLLQSRNVATVLAGAKRPEQIEDTARAIDFNLSAEDYSHLDHATRCFKDAA